MKPCSAPTCSALVTEGRCPAHRKQVDARDRFERGTASQRGYGYRWAQYSKRYLRLHPLCRMCGQVGRVEAAELVDHIVPVKDANDPNFWLPSNHQPLSRRCHAIKTADDIRKGLTR